MRASSKRFIWFFGFWIMQNLDSYIAFLRGKNEPLDHFTMVFIFSVWILPLFIFKDDKELKFKEVKK